MKRKTLLSILAVETLILLGIAWHDEKTTGSGKAMTARLTGPSQRAALAFSPRTVVADNRRVDPLFELDSMLIKFGKEHRAATEIEFAFIEQRSKWESFKKSGGTLWNSKKWMKTKEYYHRLDTVNLARECFSNTVFSSEMKIFDDPRFGLQRLCIMHEGFSEMIPRGDLWEGILDCYNSAGKEIRFGQPVEAIILKSGTLYGLSSLILCLPELQDQIKGRERLFVKSQIGSVGAYVQYLEETKGYDQDKVGLFFREPVVISETALSLIEADNEQAFIRIKAILKGITMSRKQDPEELLGYLKEVIAAVNREYLSVQK